ncbi:MAG: ISAzo13 family transposase, partial [Acidimicrobiia bacterium]|nr:ISAzo13 family transposase [Acidimicrobiia bacterium]
LGRVTVNRLLHCPTALGGARRALELSLEYSKTRQVQGAPLAMLQSIQHKLADMATDYYAARSMTYDALAALDDGGRPRIEAFMCKLFVAEKALAEGRGGISRLAQLTGMSRVTITRGAAELHGRAPLVRAATGRVRQLGSGRPPVEVVDPVLLRHLVRILEQSTAGDPMSRLKWTSKSTRGLATELTRLGHPVTARTVARCLEALGYSLQGSVKTVEGRQHPDRDAQFRYLNARVTAFLRTGDPVVSVDTKKKELVGAFRNAGQTWRPRAHPHRVFTHDFPHLGVGKAMPYGTYDIAQDRAVVNVGISHDTAEFAVASIRRWWCLMGKRSYPSARRVLISADAGGE